MKEKRHFLPAIWFVCTGSVFVCSCLTIFRIIGGNYFDWSWCIVTGIIASIPCLLRCYIASAVFGIGSIVGYLMSQQIIVSQSPHITQKAGVVLFFAELVSCIIAIVFQNVYCRIKLKKEKENDENV